LFLTTEYLALQQAATQSQGGGITDMYKRYGTYCKAFTTVMMYPSGAEVAILNCNNPRIHHSIKWVNTVPMIIDEKYKINRVDREKDIEAAKRYPAKRGRREE